LRPINHWNYDEPDPPLVDLGPLLLHQVTHPLHPLTFHEDYSISGRYGRSRSELYYVKDECADLNDFLKICHHHEMTSKLQRFGSNWVDKTRAWINITEQAELDIVSQNMANWRIELVQLGYHRQLGVYDSDSRALEVNLDINFDSVTHAQ
jgi:hypothetical protein